MGANAEIEFPVIEFRSSDLKRGTDGWHRLCKKVREACETFGCFEVVYEKISTEVREETFGLMKELIEVPVERKQKNASPLPYHGWVGPCNQVSLLYEGFGLGDASNYDSIKSFAQLMWPDGHPRFWGKWESVMINKTLLRFMKYMAPPPGEYERGLFAHTDKPVSTIICDDQVSELEIEVKDGQWIKLSLSPSSFCFVVGDPLKIKSVNHRVMMSGDNDRYSIAAFAIPVEGTIIKAPKELIDEQHPQLYKDFDFMDFFLFAFSDPAKHIDSGEQLHAFASLSPPISN
ncbi:probable inactive 2-oxoglutarate-dependent dioxygenase AOP2 [Gossypium hirsutum]|uniref:Probable inactive 2-oxoglutarate-dependent dioxygenase AOP2 n=1 Tax=Gossypium hirsutum TaxID=3635 RepID=A0ABM2ZDQ4_GOSHI|nr:probable inactive 2-oxoglutarate-dependent dioxygenase AOP2 [Gossypium hirsutum]